MRRRGPMVAVAGALAFALSATARPVVYAALIAAAYGGTDEVHQMFVPRREPSALDLVADAVGAVAGSFLFAALAALRRRRA